MFRKLSKAASRLPTSAGVSSRQHLSSVRKFSFNSAARQCYSHRNKPCLVLAPHCTYHNRQLSVLSTKIGLLQQSRPSSFKTFHDGQTQAINFSKHYRLLWARHTARDFSSQSKLSEDVEAKLDVEDLLENINKKIIFVNDDIVAINKPYGLSVFGSSPPSVNSDKPATTFVGMLSHLKDKLNCSYLDVGLSLKSFYSGLVILCKNKNSKKQMEKVLAGAQAQKIQFKTYLVITVGVPQCSHGVDLTANIAREHLHNREMSTVSDKYIHTAAKEGTMMQTHFNVQPLAVNSSVGAALVQVTINKDKWEAVEVIMSHYLSPVLGDHIYSRRTQLIRGIPFAASAHASLPGPQILPQTIVEALQSREDCVEKDLPLFVHCHKVVLNKFPTKSSPPLIITAPPQEEFLTTLKCLGLYQEGMFP
ncbi:unnamed protein product [Candidula unifasciata]|uniref:Uncharacterized protein n=1 Tax=Candidula unifasciata TaxID=100452 RepID=A0A8S3YLR2_9EUPU|nr:unnamed protein product [Candidula unifasciata]